MSYAVRGWHVFPVPPGEKKSYKSAKYSNGREWGATNDAKQIEKDFRRWPHANVGIVTGPKSGFFVVEADTPKGHAVDGIASLKALVRKHGPLPATLLAESPSGSVHYYFNYPAVVTIGNSTSKLAPGVDVRGDGGMVVAPPSRKPSGGQYRWLNKNAVANAPDWLIELCNGKDDEERKPNEKLEADDLDVLAAAVAVIPNDFPDYNGWKYFGMAIWGATRGSDYGFELFDKFSQRWTGGTYDKAATEKAWREITKGPPSKIGAGTIYHRANLAKPDWRKTKAGVSPDDFCAYMPQHVYIFKPTRESWPGSSVNSRLPPMPDGKKKFIPASLWLDRNQPVEQMTWAPGMPMLIRDRIVADGGWIDRAGVTCFNLYRPPAIELGDATKAGPWLAHVKKVYPSDTDHIVKYLAQRVQHPEIKPNHALVFGGEQGIGKDTILEPVKRAIGPWNFQEVSPQQTLGRFNGFVKSVILGINEARDLGEVDRFTLYDHTKSLTAAPPDVLRCDEKNLREHSVFNCCGVIYTTNHKTDGIYLPADDRRHYVAWSVLTREDFKQDYWITMWRWYDGGGDRHVAAYLTQLDISDFDPKAPPPKTEAFWAIVDANCPPEESELRDVLDKLENPDAVTIAEVAAACEHHDFAKWLEERKNRRTIPYRFEQCKYVPVRNAAAKEGLWIINGVRQAIYAKAALSLKARYAAAQDHKTALEKLEKEKKNEAQEWKDRVEKEKQRLQKLQNQRRRKT